MTNLQEILKLPQSFWMQLFGLIQGRIQVKE